MAFGTLYTLTATAAALPDDDAVGAADGRGRALADRRQTAAYGVDGVMSPPPPQKTPASKTRLCNNRVTAKAVITVGNIPARDGIAAKSPRNQSRSPFCASRTVGNLSSRRKSRSRTFGNLFSRPKTRFRNFR